MHYCCVIFSKEFPSDTVISKMLIPFCEYDETRSCEYPAFLWDGYRLGGRYNGKLKLSTKKDSDKYEWDYCINNPRAGRLFRSYLLEELIVNNVKHKFYSFAGREETFFPSLGFIDGFLYVDGAKISDIINIDELMECYCFIDVDGNGYAREHWDGEHFTKNGNFDELIKSAIKNSQDYYACVVDLHD